MYGKDVANFDFLVLNLQRVLDGRSRNPVVEHKYACSWSLSTQLLRDSTFCSCFINSDFAWVRKWSLFPSRRDLATFAGLASLKIDSLPLKTSTSCSLLENSSWFNLLWCENKATGSPVPFSDLAMNWTSRLLFQSDNFVIVPHLLAAPVNTVWSQQSTNLCVCRNNNDCFLWWREQVVYQFFPLILNFLNLTLFSRVLSDDRVVYSPCGLITCARLWIRKTVTSEASWICAVDSGRDQPWAWAGKRRWSGWKWSWCPKR